MDLTRYLMGNPKPVSVYGATFHKLGDRPGVRKNKSTTYRSVGATDNDVCDVEDGVVALVRYDNGAVLNIEASFTLNIKQPIGQVQLFGTKGGVTLKPEFELYTDMNGYLANIALEYPTALSFEGLFQNEINYFVNALINDVDTYPIAEDGIVIMKMIDAIYKSAECGHEIALD